MGAATVRPASSLFLWPSHALYVGASTDAVEHRHHALQVAVGLGADFRITAAGESRNCRCAVVAGNLPHRFDGRGGVHALILFDPGSPIASALRDRYLHASPLVEVDSVDTTATVAAAVQVPPRTCADAAAIVDSVGRGLLGHADLPRVVPRPAVRQALARIGAAPVDRITLPDLAHEVHLSPSRLAAVFREDVGIPLRRYLLWQRTRAAISMAVEGVALTDAAHRAGFADAAHLSRTFRQTFGLTMRELLKNSQFVQVVTCPAT